MVLCVSLATLLAGQATTPSTIHNKTALRSGGPDCGGGWPTTMTFVLLKNAGITDNEEIDFSKTKTTRIASEKTGKDLYRQVYDVRYTRKAQARAHLTRFEGDCGARRFERGVFDQRDRSICNLAAGSAPTNPRRETRKRLRGGRYHVAGCIPNGTAHESPSISRILPPSILKSCGAMKLNARRYSTGTVTLPTPATATDFTSPSLS